MDFDPQTVPEGEGRQKAIGPLPGNGSMDVAIRLFGIRRELIDRPSVEVSLPNEATLRTLLQTLGDQFGERVRHQLFSADGWHLGDTICLAVNDHIVAEEALDTPLKDMGADQPRVSLSVVFAIAGG